MAAQKEIELLLEQMRKIHFSEWLKEVDVTSAGIGAVMRYLNETEETVTAGMISEELGISTARVAVLLKRLSEKELIQKARNSEDARITVVTLTEHGRETAQNMREYINSQIGVVIDKIGFDELLELLNTLDTIRTITTVPPKFGISHSHTEGAS